jgi:hypothetical protein
MPQQRQKSDLDKAREIVSRYGTFVGSKDSMPEKINWAVAEGIALGRKEGIALAAEAIADLQGTSDA